MVFENPEILGSFHYTTLKLMKETLFKQEQRLALNIAALHVYTSVQ